MRSRLVHLYVAATCAASLVALALTDWTALAHLGSSSLLGFLALLVMALLSESLAVRLNVGETAGNSSVTFIPLLASVQLFGPPAAISLMLVTGAFGEFIVRRKVFERGIFNVAQWTLAASIGGWVFGLSGGRPLEPLLDSAVAVELSSQLIPFMLFGLVLLVFNHAAVSLAIALSQNLRFREVWMQMFQSSGASLHDMLVSPIAIAVAFLYVQWGVWGVLVVLLPLLFVRRAYLISSDLKAANTALLKALIKAIETRDPYTSGHSVRVSHLAKRIAEAMGLTRRQVADVETAALLHDIGKIEATYTAILSKPDALSQDERAVIQSHVTKGEELLRNLSSFPDDHPAHRAAPSRARRR